MTTFNIKTLVLIFDSQQNNTVSSAIMLSVVSPLDTLLGAEMLEHKTMIHTSSYDHNLYS